MIRWNPDKADKLKQIRNIDLDTVAHIIETEQFLDIIAVTSQSRHPDQLMYIITLHDYVHCVPFVIEPTGDIFIKTVFPSRKFNAIYKKGAHTHDI